MRKTILSGVMLVFLFSGPPARADIWGADVGVLTQILVNNIQQLTQLMELLRASKRQVELMEDIKQEIFRTVDTIETVRPMVDPNVYSDWTTVDTAIDRLQQEYGMPIRTAPSYQVQRDTDQSVATAMAQYNSLYSYSKQMDSVGDEIKHASETVSPGAAQKMTAHSQGILLHAMNQNLRAQATLIQLQAQNMAVKSREEKLLSKSQVATSEEMERELRKKKELFKLPRF